MKNWETLDADEVKLLTRHYTAGRAGHKIDKIIIHHNAGNLSIQGCWDVWQTREASAHYQVQSDGRIGQLVWDTDTAWHAGNGLANQTSIGIEHADISSSPWRVSDACLDNGAHLVAALCKHYGLGRPQWRKNVFPHSDFSPTECPAPLRDSQNAAYMAKAQQWYDKMTGKDTDVVTDQDKKDIARMAAENVVNYRLNGVLLRDRIIGTDGAANAANDKASKLVDQLLRTDDAAGDGRKNGMYVRMAWTDRRVREAMPILAQMQTQITALTAAVEALSAKQGLDTGEITKAIKQSVDGALKDLEIVLKTGE